MACHFLSVARRGTDTTCLSAFVMRSRRAWDEALGVNRVCVCPRLFVEVAVLVAVVETAFCGCLFVMALPCGSFEISALAFVDKLCILLAMYNDYNTQR
jgi:hypothetical protein